jgi:histidinol-phosphate/aromatic aminotransferase/cobyric acid decarboxylase-like protein
MKYPVDLTLFNRKAHNPSFFSLQRALPAAKDEIVDFCVPCNPYFPTPEMFTAWAQALPQVLKYYPTDSAILGDHLAEFLGHDPVSLVLANGSTELISWIDRLFIQSSIATPVPTFGRWTDQPRESGKRVHLFELRAENDFRFDPNAFVSFVRKVDARAVVVCNPNNPDGGYLKRNQMIKLLDDLSDREMVIVDESFIDFVDEETHASVSDEARARPNVIVLKSLGKNFGLHGVRFGYAIAHSQVAARLRTALPRWNLNSVAEMILFSLDGHLAEYRTSLEKIFEDRRRMFERLSAFQGITVLPSQANFLLMRLEGDIRGEELRNFLITEHGVLIRECGNKIGIDSSFIRIACRPTADVDRLISGLRAFGLTAANSQTVKKVSGCFCS